jgi:asparagine synthase (glutamine-hydrolysing)
MCGLFGWALPRKSSQTRDLLVRLTDLLAHRGPDGSGYWLDDTASKDFQIGLGHRRLSIIDIGGGQQPMWSADGAFGLVFNGEIYNYIELRDTLRSLGHVFQTDSDTEVLIESYRAWGVEAVRRFRGMFAFALWDVGRQQVVLARDPFGKKPLFLSSRANAVLFSSEILPLLEFPGTDRTLDHNALGHYFLNRYVPGPTTFFQSVSKLPPGSLAIWRDGELSTSRYFVPPIATHQADTLEFPEAVELFEATFDDAIRLRMRSDAPFGAYLSGGLDSSAVVATMAKYSAGPVRTFSVGFQEQSYSELGPAKQVASAFGTQHSELVVDSRSFLEKWPEALIHRGAPVSEASDIPILMLSQAASSVVKMVLTGEGSDELLAGYPKHRAEPWAALYQSVIPAPVHRHIVAPLVSSLPYDMRRLKTLATAFGERDPQARMQAWFGGASLADRADILGDRLVGTRPPDNFPFSAPSQSALRRTLFFDQTSWLPDNLLERGDRMMMAGSIEGRMPFMDVELAATAARFPDRFLSGRGGGKLVLRAAMQKVLPRAILDRKKVGFRVPFNEWFRSSYKDFMTDLLISDSSSVLRICSSGAIRKLMQEHVAGRQNHERLLWSLANLELFFRTFKPSGLETLMDRAA